MSNATVANGVLVVMVFFLPRLIFRGRDLDSAVAAAILGLCILGLTLIIGIVAVVKAWRTSKRNGMSMALSDFAPLGVFLIGILVLFVLIK